MGLQKEFEQITKYAADWDKIGNYAIGVDELNAIANCAGDIFEVMLIAFRFGFEKGCRATKKAAKV